MSKSALSLKPSEEYVDRLCRQLEECSLDSVSCEMCTNEARCRELYDMLPIFISENNYQRYSRGFSGLRITKGAKNTHAFCTYLSPEKQM